MSEWGRGCQSWSLSTKQTNRRLKLTLTGFFLVGKLLHCMHNALHQWLRQWYGYLSTTTEHKKSNERVDKRIIYIIHLVLVWQSIMAAASKDQGAMSESQADRQLRQMMDFLRLEGKEKANEIRTKAEHDYNMEKQMKVQKEKAKIREKMKQLEQERLTQQRVYVT